MESLRGQLSGEFEKEKPETTIAIITDPSDKF